MENLTEEYLLLFNTISDVEQTLEKLRQKLVLAQQKAEELFIGRID